MLILAIESQTNNITAYATAQDAAAVPNAERFRNEAGLAKLAANWPAALLVEIYNSMPGVSPVKKFTNRKTAVSRIWQAIQSLRRSLPDEAAAQNGAVMQPDPTATPFALARRSGPFAFLEHGVSPHLPDRALLFPLLEQRDGVSDGAAHARAGRPGNFGLVPPPLNAFQTDLEPLGQLFFVEVAAEVTRGGAAFVCGRIRHLDKSFLAGAFGVASKSSLPLSA